MKVHQMQPESHELKLTELLKLFMEMELEGEKFILSHLPDQVKTSNEAQPLLRYIETERAHVETCKDMLSKMPGTRYMAMMEWDFEALATIGIPHYCAHAFDKTHNIDELMRAAFKFETNLIESLKNIADSIGHPEELDKLIGMERESLEMLQGYLNAA